MGLRALPEVWNIVICSDKVVGRHSIPSQIGIITPILYLYYTYTIPIMERVMTDKEIKLAKVKPSGARIVSVGDSVWADFSSFNEEEYNKYAESILSSVCELKTVTINGKLTNRTKSSILKAMRGE